MLSAAQRAGVAALPEPLPLGHSLDRIFAERVSQLPSATQHLLLVGAAEETGDLATVLQAAGVAGVGSDALEAAERAGLVSVRTAGCSSGIRWCAPRSINMQPLRPGKVFTATWR